MSKKKQEKKRIIHSINDLSRGMSTATVMFHQAIAEKAGLTATDHKYVDILLQHGDMTAGKLAEHTGLTTGAVTGVIDRLEKEGLVERARDPKDRRKVLVVLKKEAALRRIGPAFEEMQGSLDNLYAGFSLDELHTIERYLKVIIDFYQRQIEALKA